MAKTALAEKKIEQLTPLSIPYTYIYIYIFFLLLYARQLDMKHTTNLCAF